MQLDPGIDCTSGRHEGMVVDKLKISSNMEYIREICIQWSMYWKSSLHAYTYNVDSVVVSDAKHVESSG